MERRGARTLYEQQQNYTVGQVDQHQGRDTLRTHLRASMVGPTDLSTYLASTSTSRFTLCGVDVHDSGEGEWINSVRHPADQPTCHL